MGKELGVIATLGVVGHPRFDVKIVDQLDGSYFGEGFKSFILQYCLEDGSLVQFGYQGDSKFCVRVFDRDECESKYDAFIIEGYEINDCRKNRCPNTPPRWPQAASSQPIGKLIPNLLYPMYVYMHVALK